MTQSLPSLGRAARYYVLGIAVCGVVTWSSAIVWGSDVIWTDPQAWADAIVWGSDSVGEVYGGAIVWGSTGGLTAQTTAWKDLSGGSRSASSTVR